MMRLFFLLVLGAFETTAVSLPLLAFTSLRVPWPLLAFTLALGWLAEWIASALPARRRLVLASGACLAALWLPAWQPAGLGPALLNLVTPGSGFLASYSLLLIGLFLFWRGTHLLEHDSAAVETLFQRAAAAGVISLVLGTLLGTGAPAGSAELLIQIVALGGLGLAALALAHVQEAAAGPDGPGWRWLATLLAAVALVLTLATFVASLAGGSQALNLLQGLLAMLLLPFALLGSLIAWLVLSVIGGPLTRLMLALQAALARLQLRDPPTAQAETPDLSQGAALESIQRLAEGATFLMALIPLVILVLVILFLQRRRGRARRTDEERESLGLREGLGRDLHDLFARLRKPFRRTPQGLHAALAALRSNDPATRIRRAYLRLLLRLEATGYPRPPARTPAEFSATAATSLDPGQVITLTTAYEHARYNPAGATLAEAEAAEAALPASQE